MITYSFGNLNELKADARQLGLDLRSTKEPLRRAVQEVMIPSFQKNFAAEGRPSWTPAARSYDHPLLNETGKLEGAATTLAIWTIDREQAKINPGALAARVGARIVHQTGYSRATKTGTHTIPARPFIMMQNEDEEKIALIFDTWIAERIARRWG